MCTFLLHNGALWDLGLVHCSSSKTVYNMKNNWLCYIGQRKLQVELKCVHVLTTLWAWLPWTTRNFTGAKRFPVWGWKGQFENCQISKCFHLLFSLAQSPFMYCQNVWMMHWYIRPCCLMGNLTTEFILPSLTLHCPSYRPSWRVSITF